MPTEDDPSRTDSDGEVVPDTGTAAAAESEPVDELTAGPVRRRRRMRGWVQIVLSLGITILVVILLLPQLRGEGRSVDTLRGLSIPLATTALALEAASLVSYSVMTLLVFGASIPFLTLLRIDLTITGLSHAVPAGGATAAVLRMRLLQQAGVPGSSAVAGATV
jgi:hypothetical protein